MRLWQMIVAALIGALLWLAMTVYGYYAVFGVTVFKPLFTVWDNIKELILTFIRGFMIVLVSVLVSNLFFKEPKQMLMGTHE